MNLNSIPRLRSRRFGRPEWQGCRALAVSLRRPPAEGTLNMTYCILVGKRVTAEYPIGYAGNDFAFSGNQEGGLLSIPSVHPIREDAVREFLSKSHPGWLLIEGLIAQGKLIGHPMVAIGSMGENSWGERN